MTHRRSVFVLGLMLAASPVAASGRAPGPMPSPTDGVGARYCLHVEAALGSRLETVQCWTRAEWAEQDVNVDQEWAKEGVAVRR